MSDSNNKMKNPYEDDYERDDVRISRVVAWVSILLFLLICLIPPVWRNFSEKDWRPVIEFFRIRSTLSKEHLTSQKAVDPSVTRDSPNLRDHLISFESRLEKAKFRDLGVDTYQGLVTKFLKEGNRKVFIGKNNTLFYRPSIEALTGYGPIKSEPDTVAKDPNRPDWVSPKEVILGFKDQLEERGIDLLLVPVPVKAMIYPELIGGNKKSKPLQHKDAKLMYDELRSDGVEVLDLSDQFWAWKNEEEKGLFLKQDTHWTTETMQKVAKEISKRVLVDNELLSGESKFQSTLQNRTGSHYGDLVGMLGGDEKVDGFGAESQLLETVLDASTGDGVELNRKSPIVLLGDSFVNIFHDPTLGFGDTEGGFLHAGLAQHLMSELGVQLDVHAINGSGATEVRAEFARRPDDEVRGKKLVIWALAARDILMSESTAKEAGVEFREITFNPNQSKTSEVKSTDETVAVEVVDKSVIGDPNSTPYPDSLYVVRMRVSEEVQQKLNSSESEILVYLWAFQDREILESAQLEVGGKYEMKLVEWEKVQGELGGVNRSDTLDLESEGIFLNVYFAEGVELQN